MEDTEHTIHNRATTGDEEKNIVIIANLEQRDFNANNKGGPKHIVKGLVTGLEGARSRDAVSRRQCLGIAGRSQNEELGRSDDWPVSSPTFTLQ